MIIIAGRIHITPGRRDAFLSSSYAAIVNARSAPGCRDFVVAADPIEPDRVNIYEEWDTEPELAAFRGTGPSQELTDDIVHADISRHRVARSRPASAASPQSQHRGEPEEKAVPGEMTPDSHDAAAGEQFAIPSSGQDWIVAWCPPPIPPSRTPHGAQGIV